MAPPQGHLKALERIFRYLIGHTSRRLVVDVIYQSQDRLEFVDHQTGRNFI